MIIFLIPNTPLVYCYFFIPPIPLPLTLNPLLPEMETPSFSGAKI